MSTSGYSSTSTQRAPDSSTDPPLPMPGQPGHDHVAVVVSLLDVGDGSDYGVSALETKDEGETAVLTSRPLRMPALPSSVPTRIVTTMWGKTTPLWRGRTGRVSWAVSDGCSISSLIGGTFGTSLCRIPFRF
jgi:hypothetical protein